MRSLKRAVMIAVLGAVVLSLSSCLWFVARDNSFTVGGTVYDLKTMYVGSVEVDPGLYMVEIFLAPDGVSYDEATDTFSGSGPGGMIVLISESNGLAAGTYGIPQDPEDPLPWTYMVYMTMQTDYDWTGMSTVEPDSYAVAGIEMGFESTGTLTIGEPTIGDWLLEWSYTGADEEETPVSFSGKFQGNIESTVAPIDFD